MSSVLHTEYALRRVGLGPGWTQLRPHPVQAALWCSRARVVIVPAGRGSGKTELSLRRLVRYLPVRREWEDPRFFYAAPTLQQAKRIAWSRILALLPGEWIASISYSDLCIHTIFGSQLWVVGLDVPQRIEGVQWDGCIIDEMSDIRPGTITRSILPALSWRNGWMWCIGVPKRFGIGAAEYRQMYERAASGKYPEEAAFTWPSSDILPEEAIRYARERLDRVDYDEQFSARFIDVRGAVYHAFDEGCNVRPCAYRSDYPIIVGCDFNVSPMCWICAHKIDDRLEVFDEIVQYNTTTFAALDVLMTRYADHRAGWIICGDASAAQRRTSAHRTDYAILAQDARLRAAGRTLRFTRSNPPRADRIAATNALFCSGSGQRRLFIDPRCKYLLHDLRVVAYIPGTRDVDTRVKEHGHITDALGYVVWMLFPLVIPIRDSQPLLVTYTVASHGGAI